MPGVEQARGLYKSLGLDPTKTRPSNEALLRRVLKGEALYRISTLVDALNLCSLREQVPFGLYDLERVSPPVTLQLGAPGAGYEGIRKAWVNVEGRPVLVDAQGPFGNPTSDSGRTCIRLETTRRAGDRLHTGGLCRGAPRRSPRPHGRGAHASLRRHDQPQAPTALRSLSCPDR